MNIKELGYRVDSNQLALATERLDLSQQAFAKRGQEMRETRHRIAADIGNRVDKAIAKINDLNKEINEFAAAERKDA